MSRSHASAERAGHLFSVLCVFVLVLLGTLLALCWAIGVAVGWLRLLFGGPRG